MNATVSRGPLREPPGYPRSYERTLRLRDGRAVFVRPVVPADAPQLAEAIRTADADTLRRRFMGGTPRPTPDVITHLSTVDYQGRFALVAADAVSCRGAAIARYELLEPGVAEVAVAVDPVWRRVGLATALVEMLAEAALDRGIHTFSAYYLAENRPVAALLDLAAGATRVIGYGYADTVVTLDRDSVAAAIRDMDRVPNRHPLRRDGLRRPTPQPVATPPAEATPGHET